MLGWSHPELLAHRRGSGRAGSELRHCLENRPPKTDDAPAEAPLQGPNRIAIAGNTGRGPATEVPIPVSGAHRPRRHHFSELRIRPPEARHHRFRPTVGGFHQTGFERSQHGPQRSNPHDQPARFGLREARSELRETLTSSQIAVSVSATSASATTATVTTASAAATATTTAVLLLLQQQQPQWPPPATTTETRTHLLLEQKGEESINGGVE